MKETIIKLLNNKNIDYNLINHEKVYTIEDMIKQNITQYGLICKNLFLRNAKGDTHYLLCCCYDTQIDLHHLEKTLNCTRLSFASNERLKKYLNLESGYVSPFGIINDDSKSVKVVFEKKLVDKTDLGFHPNLNDATIFISYNDIKKIIEDHGNDFTVIDL